MKEEVELRIPADFKKGGSGAGAGTDKPYGLVFWDVAVTDRILYVECEYDESFFVLSVLV